MIVNRNFRRALAPARPRARSLLYLLAALVPAAAVRAEGAPPDFELFWRLSPSVVKIEAHDRDGRVSVGSGVLVGDGLVATNCHVTRHATRVLVARQDRRWDARAQASDLEHDLCVLRAPGVTGKIAPVRRASRPWVGQAVTAVGYIGGRVPQISGGEVRALYRYDGGRVIQSTASFNSGASGGGLFDQDGNLIGIIAFRHQGGEGLHFALPVEWLYRSTLDPARATAVVPLGPELPFWQRAGDRQPYFLRAAALEAGRDWPGLRDLAEEWAAAEGGAPDAWLSLGRAHERMGGFERAIAAYNRAIQADLECAEAWYGLGLAYAARGESQRVQEVQRVLSSLNQDLARKLAAGARLGRAPSRPATL